MKIKTLMFVSLYCAALAAADAQIVGKVEYAEGKPEILRNGETIRALEAGFPIENMDTIRTQADGRVVISFSEASGLGGSIDIAPESTAIIRQDLVSGKIANEAQILGGSVNLKVKRLAGDKASFRARTPTAVLGVRGTEFVVMSFNGAALVACSDGEVFCSSWSELTMSAGNAESGVSSVPGNLVEVLESGSLKTGAFPAGDFDANWKDVSARWKDFQVELFTADPVSFMNSFVSSWDESSGKVASGAARLRANPVLKGWLAAAKAGKNPGTRAQWVKERPEVMKDLIAIRPNMVLAMMTWYRLQELIPYVAKKELDRTLVNGQTVRAFINRFKRDSRDVSSAFALFYAAEKQYMIRNEGLSPFMEF